MKFFKTLAVTLLFILPKFSLQGKPNSQVINEMVQDFCQKYFFEKKILFSKKKEVLLLEENFDEDDNIEESYDFPLERLSETIENRLLQIREEKIFDALVKKYSQEISNSLKSPEDIDFQYDETIVVQYIQKQIEDSQKEIKNILINIEKENSQYPLTEQDEKNIAHNAVMYMRKSLISIKNKMGQKISLVSNPWFFYKKAEEEKQWAGTRLPNHDFHITILRSIEIDENEQITQQRYTDVLKILLTDTLNDCLKPKLNFLDFSMFTVLNLKEFFIHDLENQFKLHISLFINPKDITKKKFRHFMKENEKNFLHVDIYKHFQNYILTFN